MQMVSDGDIFSLKKKKKKKKTKKNKKKKKTTKKKTGFDISCKLSLFGDHLH